MTTFSPAEGGLRRRAAEAGLELRGRGEEGGQEQCGGDAPETGGDEDQADLGQLKKLCKINKN